MTATALATKVSWEEPFIPITAAHRGLVGSTMWSGDVERVLKAPESNSESSTQFGPWHRVSVYSAWVAEPSEADEEAWEESEVAEEREEVADERRRRARSPSASPL